jgi:hypothetical protein
MTAFPLTAGDIEDAFVARAGALEYEAGIVYEDLVVPSWSAPTRHGFPRTLYGFVMSAMACLDELSMYALPSEPSQTPRMRALLATDFGVTDEVAYVTVKLWRHTLMHVGDPHPLVSKSRGLQYEWLLQWAENELPPEQQLVFVSDGVRRVLGFALLPFLASLTRACRVLRATWAKDYALQERAEQTRARLELARQIP